MTERARYGSLDGLRGIAAVAVVCFHLAGLGLGAAQLTPHGYLAVDFFFVLSGFVIAHAYQDRMPAIGLRGFVRRRLVRLLPISTLGILLGASYFLFRLATQANSPYGLGEIGVATALNLVLLPKPWVSPVDLDPLFMTNSPVWSLSLEVAVNLAWAAVLHRMGGRGLAILAALAGVALLVAIRAHGSADLGAMWSTYLGGVARCVFGFTAGLVLWRFRPAPSGGAWRRWAAAALLVAVLAWPHPGATFDAVAIGLAFPGIVYLAVSADRGRESPLESWLGEVSYPLYALHLPVLYYVNGAAKLLRLDGLGDLFFLAVPLCVVVALLAWRLYDLPVRTYLSGRRRGPGLLAPAPAAS